MLEETVILETDTTDASEDGALHEVVGIGSKPVNDIVIIPDINLRNAGVCARKRFGAIPPDVVGKIKLVTAAAHVVVEGIMLSLSRILNCRPFLEGTLDSYIVIIDLVATSNHHVEGSLLVGSQDIIPKSRTCTISP